MHVTHKIADTIRRRVARIDGVVDPRIVQRLNYPAYKILVDRAKAADVGLSQDDVIKQVIAAFNSSIQFNKRIFWVDPVSGNQYFVGVQYPLEDVKSLETLLDVPITGVNQIRQDRRVATAQPPELFPVEQPVSGEPIAPPIPLSNIVTLERTEIPTEITDLNLHKTIDLNVGVYGRDLGHVADDVYDVIEQFGKIKEGGSARPRPARPGRRTTRTPTPAASCPVTTSSSAANTPGWNRPSRTWRSGFASRSSSSTS